jgi:hypothetical protein
LIRHLVARLGKLRQHEIALFGAAALAYGGLELVEGGGLFLKKRWAEWLTVVATRLLIPLELYELVRKPSALKGAGLIVNILIVLYLVRWFEGRGSVKRTSTTRRARQRALWPSGFRAGFWPQGQFDHSTSLIRLPRSLGFRQTSWPDAERRGVELSHGRPHGEDPRVARAGQEVLATHWEIEARSAPFPAESLIE